MSTTLKGGHRLDRHLRAAKKGTNIEGIDVGFFSTAKYPDGTFVSQVANQHEFGIGVPERPFIRNAIKNAEDGVSELMEGHLKTQSRQADRRIADTVGAHVAGEIQREIVRLREPPNAPSTIARKGSSNPLVDTGVMRQSVTWRVVD